MIISTIVLYATLVACGILIGFVAARYDLYIREPLVIILIVTLLGAAAMWLTGQLQLEVIRRLARWPANGEFALLAGTTEELAKFAVVILVALALPRLFDEPIDGLIYGSFAGLGCALEESVALLTRTGATMTLPPQEPIRLAGHLIMGGIGSFGIGLLLMNRTRAWLAVFGSLLAAILLHTAWDVVAFAARDHYDEHKRIAVWQTIAPVGLMLGGMISYRWLAGVGARLTLTHLQLCDLKTRQCPPN